MLSKFLLSLPVVAMLTLASCHCPHVESPAPFKVGHVLTTDGNIMSFCDYVRSDKDAVAIVYHVNEDPEDPISGYAVYLSDLEPASFCSEESMEQGTSTDISAFDGNENTHLLYSFDKAESPLAKNVFDLWTYGQSAYVPSVAQIRQLQSVKDFINPRIEAIGGDPLPDDADNCWYWSSTEVNGQNADKAWLVSMKTGFMQETPKTQVHKSRPVVTIYKFR